MSIHEAAPRFSLRQLEVCIAASELGSFSQTANRLHLSPSAVSGLVAELERALGFTLFERTTRRVSLTPAGRKFLPVAIGLQQQFTRAQDAVLDIRRRTTDVVRIAAPMVFAAAILPPLLDQYRAIAPGVTVRVVDAGVEWLADRVLARDADIAIGPLRKSRAEVDHVPLFESEWLMWFSPGDPLLKVNFGWADIAERRLFAAGRDFVDSIAPHVMAPAAIGAASDVEIVDNMTTAFGMTAAGLGVTFSPAYARAFAERFGIVARPMPPGTVPRAIALYKPAGREASSIIQAFELFLVSELTRLS